MQSDNVEFLMSKYLDGTLSESELIAFDAWLEQNPEAQIMLAEYHRVDAVLRAMPLPQVRWDAFAQSISAAVDAAQEEQQEQASHAYRMPAWIRAVIPIALAASVVIMAWIGLRAYLQHSNEPMVSIVNKPNVIEPGGEGRDSAGTRGGIGGSGETVKIAIGPETDPIVGPPVVQISVGPSAAVKDEPTVVQYSDDVVSRPSSVSIASGVALHEDGADLLRDMDAQ